MTDTALRDRAAIRTIDYGRYDYESKAHHERYTRFVEVNGLLCQECGGMGYWNEYPLGGVYGMKIPCAWCEGTGKVTRWLRGQWLRSKR
jgi:DnaJ-class molecular chaperone